ncbi:MAG: hypothetical protein WCK11_03775 [Candidatus Falkowbacteria bacterium]
MNFRASIIRNKKSLQKIGFIRNEAMFFLNSQDYSVADPVKKQTQRLLRPVFGTFKAQTKKETKNLNFFSTPGMGKAVAKFQQANISNTNYNFFMWKGVGQNLAGQDLVVNAKKTANRIFFPLDEQSAFPFFILRHRGRILPRLLGGAFYQELRAEALETSRMERVGLRVPKVIATFQFSNSFQGQYVGIKPNQSFLKHLATAKGAMSAGLYRQVITNREVIGIKSMALGQNIRAFRNVLRVSELAQVLSQRVTSKSTQKISAILELSAAILAGEKKSAMSVTDYVRQMAELFGEQVATLINHNILHAKLAQHKHDITLAGEFCDFDDCNPSVSKKMLQLMVYDQIFYVAAQLQVIGFAASQCRVAAKSIDIVATYTQAILNQLTKQKRSRLAELCQGNVFGSMSSLAGRDMMIRANLSGNQQLFSAIKKSLAQPHGLR